MGLTDKIGFLAKAVEDADLKGVKGSPVI